MIKTPSALIAGVVAMVAIVVAGVTIMSFGITASARMIIMQGMLTGVIGLVPVLIAATKADKAAEATAEMHHDLQNGLIPAKVQEGITAMASDPNQPSVTINPDEKAV